jgi:hypothetical protein
MRHSHRAVRCTKGERRRNGQWSVIGDATGLSLATRFLSTPLFVLASPGLPGQTAPTTPPPLLLLLVAALLQ